MIGARSLILKDIVPFSLCASGPSGTERILGINATGLERKGFTAQRRAKIKQAFRILFRDGLAIKEALERLRQEYPDDEDVMKLIVFIENSERGIYNMKVG